jgi:hypothetical protein
MQVGWGATAKDWSALVAREASDPVEGAGTKQSLLRLGGGEKGFLETRPSGDPTTTKTDGDLYYVYILSKHDNILEFSVWPATMPQVTHLTYALQARIPGF